MYNDSLDYRLAPQYPFPAALDDCYFALLWVASHSAQLGIDPQRIAIGDASAGCGSAAALAQSAHDRWEIDPVLQMLVYPMLDDQIMHENPSFQKESKYHLYARQCARDREPQ